MSGDRDADLFLIVMCGVLILAVVVLADRIHRRR
jgi:hypothetical protein